MAVLFTILSMWLLICSVWGMIKTKKEDLVELSVLGFILSILVLAIVAPLCFSELTFTRESDIIEYKLKEPLHLVAKYKDVSKISSDKDSDGRSITLKSNDRDITEEINIDKGSTVQIKVIEERKGFSERKKWSFNNARVFLVYYGELYEIGFDEVKNQGIDKVVKDMYLEMKEKGSK